MERELKLVLDAPGYFRLTTCLAGYGGERWLVNHYFDTPGGALRSRGAMLRIRETEEARVAGLKQALVVRRGAFEASEWEEPLADADWRRLVRAGGDLRTLDHPVVREALALAGEGALPYVGSVRVLRKAYRIGRRIALELDLVVYEDGGQDWELEVETERPEMVRPFLEELLERRGVAWREQTRTKYERFLARPPSERFELCEGREGEVVMTVEGLVVRRAPFSGSALFATRPFAPGERLLEIEGPLLSGELPPNRGRRWVQVGPASFLDVSGTPARHVRHSCLPAAGIHGSRSVVAMRRIAPGAEVTLDYAMTERDLQLVCTCGTSACRGLVVGYRRLPERARRRYAGWISEYLEQMAAREDESGGVAREVRPAAGPADPFAEEPGRMRARAKDEMPLSPGEASAEAPGTRGTKTADAPGASPSPRERR